MIVVVIVVVIVMLSRSAGEPFNHSCSKILVKNSLYYTEYVFNCKLYWSVLQCGYQFTYSSQFQMLSPVSTSPSFKAEHVISNKFVFYSINNSILVHRYIYLFTVVLTFATREQCTCGMTAA